MPILFLWLKLLLSIVVSIILNLFVSYQSFVFSSFLGLIISINSSSDVSLSDSLDVSSFLGLIISINSSSDVSSISSCIFMISSS